jgi:S1-C subfamily serine protease
MRSVLVVLVVAAMLSMSAVKLTPMPDFRTSVVIVNSGTGFGSGAIIGPNTVLTAEHVVPHLPLVVTTLDGRAYNVVGVRKDPDSDLACVRIAGTFTERPLILDSRPLAIGESVTVVGTPMSTDLMNCVLRGNVTNTDRSIEAGGTCYVNLDILDAHGTLGCSGGPVIDGRGHVRGVVVVTVINMLGAIPVEELDGMAEQVSR